MRWNSTFLMLDGLLKNKRAVRLMGSEQLGSNFPAFTEADWSVIEAVTNVLRPIYMATIELQDRRCSIASVVPFYRTIRAILLKPSPSVQKLFDAAKLSKKLQENLDARMQGWSDNRFFKNNLYKRYFYFLRLLVISTSLDPRFKFSFFDDWTKQRYRAWLEEEAQDEIKRLNGFSFLSDNCNKFIF